MSGLTILAAVFVLYALVASKLERWWITAPMVFVLAGAVLGPGGTGLLPVSLSSETALVIAELTLALLLFADASTIRFRDVEGDATLPRRLLFVGLPLTVIAGIVVARLMFPDLGWANAALIATILAPTDAALGLAVVTNRAVPVRIRRALNVESGLNDGIATPFVTLFIAVIAAEEGLTEHAWGLEALVQIGLAIATAIVVGFIGGKLVSLAKQRGWTSPTSEQLAVLALALLAYGGAVAIGGNGFVAAFVGGILFSVPTKGMFTEPVEFTETLALFASFLVWTIFGAVFVGGLLGDEFSPLPVVYALASLTLVRMIPVALAMTGTGLRRDTVAFMGWFGPRGLASVVFTLVALEDLQAEGTSGTFVEVATWTILLSVVLHGITAGPFAARYGAAVSGERDIPENASVHEPRIRIRDLAGRHRRRPHNVAT